MFQVGDVVTLNKEDKMTNYNNFLNAIGVDRAEDLVKIKDVDKRMEISSFTNMLGILHYYTKDAYIVKDIKSLDILNTTIEVMSLAKIDDISYKDGSCALIYHSFTINKIPTIWFEKANIVRCHSCGKYVADTHSVYNRFNHPICNHCMRVLRNYYTPNNMFYQEKKPKGLTYGFELECFPYSDIDKATLYDEYFYFEGTYDDSIRNGGVEFKTPIYTNLRDVKKMLREVYPLADFSDKRAGQHINIGHVKYTLEIQNFVILHSENIFNPMLDEMKAHKYTMKRICGRYFTRYAHYNDTNRKFKHRYAINLEKIGIIEFRFAKFYDIEQYYNLIKMCGEIMQVIITAYYKSTKDKEVLCSVADELGLEILNIYKRYSTPTKKTKSLPNKIRK